MDSLSLCFRASRVDEAITLGETRRPATADDTGCDDFESVLDANILETFVIDTETDYNKRDSGRETKMAERSCSRLVTMTVVGEG